MKRNTHTNSQHFLRSPALVSSLIKKTSIKNTDTVYDIGAGSGVITSALAQKVAHVVAIEIDPRAAAILRKNTQAAQYSDRVTVKEGDFLTMPLPSVPYKIFSNIPFHISSAIVQRFFNTPHSPEAAYLIVQKQFGQKLVSSQPGRFTSQLGMLIGAEYSVKSIASLRREDFIPRPGVDTVLIALEKRSRPLIPREALDAYKEFTQRCFSDQTFLARQPLEVIGMTAGLSPSRLTINQWCLLFNARKR